MGGDVPADELGLGKVDLKVGIQVLKSGKIARDTDANQWRRRRVGLDFAHGILGDRGPEFAMEKIK